MKVTDLHIALLGDSIFDNARYVAGEPAVIDQLKSVLPAGSCATLLAVDGSVTSDVIKQIESLPKDTTHIFISAGGNDALHASLALQGAATVEELLDRLFEVQEEFNGHYYGLLSSVKETGKPVAVLTIYDSIPSLERWEETALSIFNDVIIRRAAEFAFPVIDLRVLCNEESDYSSVSPIEPSSKGGLKIVKKIAKVLETFDFRAINTVVF